jgi:catalase
MNYFFLIATFISFSTYSIQENVRIFGIEVPLHGTERVPENESQAIEEVNDLFTTFFQKEYSKPRIDSSSNLEIHGSRRGVHPKTHGCVKADFIVNKKIEKHDQVGIFIPGKKYETIIRFSNAGPRANNHDSWADSRGIGIKVYSPPGEQLLEVGEDSQDFTLNSTDTFFADNARNYTDFIKIALQETDNFKEAAKVYTINILKKIKPILGLRIKNAFDKIQNLEATNPVSINYFSISPFQHGKNSYSEVVKYAVKPCNGTWKEKYDKENPNFLRENLTKHVNNKDSCFSFQVQKYNGTQAIEDLTIPWKESDSKFYELAKIMIPKQNFVDEIKCEKVVINPWNTLPAHKPIGGINRLRLASYLFSIEQRKKSRYHKK